MTILCCLRRLLLSWPYEIFTENIFPNVFRDKCSAAAAAVLISSLNSNVIVAISCVRYQQREAVWQWKMNVWTSDTFDMAFRMYILFYSVDDVALLCVVFFSFSFSLIGCCLLLLVSILLEFSLAYCWRLLGVSISLDARWWWCFPVAFFISSTDLSIRSLPLLLLHLLLNFQFHSHQVILGRLIWMFITAIRLRPYAFVIVLLVAMLILCFFFLLLSCVLSWLKFHFT